MFASPYDRTRVRKLLDQIQTDADFDAFCLDCFPAAQARFASGMDRVQKTTLLLQLEPDPARIAGKLRQRFAYLWLATPAVTVPRPGRGLWLAGLTVVLVLAAGLVAYLLSEGSTGPLEAPAGAPHPRPQTTSLTSDLSPPTLRPMAGHVAVEQEGDIHSTGSVNITASPGAQDTLVKAHGRIEAGGDVTIGVTAPTAASFFPRRRKKIP